MSNETLIEHFVKSKKERSPRTQENYRRFLEQFTRSVNKPLDEVTLKDIDKFLDGVPTRCSRATYRLYLRQFYKWHGNKKLVKALPVTRKDMMRTKPINTGDLLTKEDIASMVKVASSFRDQAVIAVLYETAARVSEFLGLTVGDVVFDKFGAFFSVSGKTGTRRIRIIESVPYLQQWMQTLDSKKRDAPLWQSRETPHEALSIGGVARILRTNAKKAGITKPCNPHWLRHSRLTETAKFLVDAKNKLFAGWTPDSRMSGIYVHLSGSDLDEDLLKASGVKVSEKVETSPMAPKKCRRCETVNPGISEFCLKCGLPFDESKVIESTMEERVNMKDLQALIQENIAKALAEFKKKE
jgi:site-specific recombinase XerD